MKSFIVKIYRAVKKWEELDRQASLRSKYDIHPSFRFNGLHINFYGHGKLKIGENTYLGSSSTIQLKDGYEVIIGAGCSISHNVRMYTSSKLPDGDFKDKSKLGEKAGNILIGNFVWIGANVFINPGIIIGDNSVIGANSVVTKDVEPNSIYGGVPARLIRYKS